MPCGTANTLKTNKEENYEKEHQGEGAGGGAAIKPGAASGEGGKVLKKEPRGFLGRVIPPGRGC